MSTFSKYKSDLRKRQVKSEVEGVFIEYILLFKFSWLNSIELIEISQIIYMN